MPAINQERFTNELQWRHRENLIKNIMASGMHLVTHRLRTGLWPIYCPGPVQSTRRAFAVALYDGGGMIVCCSIFLGPLFISVWDHGLLICITTGTFDLTFRTFKDLCEAPVKLPTCTCGVGVDVTYRKGFAPSLPEFGSSVNSLSVAMHDLLLR